MRKKFLVEFLSAKMPVFRSLKLEAIKLKKKNNYKMAEIILHTTQLHELE